MIYKTYVAMEITGSDIRVLSVKKNRIRKWMSAPLPEGAVKDGQIIDVRAISVIVDNMFKSLHLNRNRVILTVTGLPFIYRVIGMPSDAELVDSEAIERAARREMSLDEEDMYLLWQSTGGRPAADEKDYFVVGVPRTSLKPLMETLERAEIKPYILDLKPLALARAAGAADALVVSMEDDYYDIVLVSGGMVRVMHSVTPVARPGEQGEAVNELLDGLNMAVKSFNRDYPQNTLHVETPILITGNMILDPEILNLLRDVTGRPVSILKSLLELPPESPPELYTTCAGLAAKKVKLGLADSNYSDIDLDLLSHLKQPRSYRTQLLYAGAAVFLLLLGALVYRAYDMKSNAIDRADLMKEESVIVTRQLANTQKAYNDALADRQVEEEKLLALQKELDAISGEYEYIMGLKHDYAGRINIINQAFPAGTDYDRMNMLPSEITVEGKSADKFDVVKIAQSLEERRSFASIRIDRIDPVPDTLREVTFTVIIKEHDAK